MSGPDSLRVVTLLVALLAMATFPSAIWLQGRPRSAWLAVAGCELLLLAAALGVLDHLGEPIVWHRTPLVFVASTFILAFSATVIYQRGGRS